MNYILYTDGACSPNPGKGGYAGLIICPNGNEKEYQGYQEHATNNQMELQAIIEGLKNIPEGESVTVYTDSNYAYQGATLWMFNWFKNGWKTANKKPVKNKEQWQELNRLIYARTVGFVHINGHAGNEFNERVDELAVKARS